jgi:hypothetical protein
MIAIIPYQTITSPELTENHYIENKFLGTVLFVLRNRTKRTVPFVSSTKISLMVGIFLN